MRFLKWKYGQEPVPPETKIKSLEDIKREDDLIAKAKAGQLAERNGHTAGAPPAKSPHARTFNVYVGDEHFKVDVEPTDAGAWGIRTIAPGRPAASPRSSAAATAAKPAPSAAGVATPAKTQVAAGEAAIEAPMPGILIRHLVAEGAQVKAGQPIVVLEAMKMENALPSPKDGVVKKLPVKPGTKVTKGTVLAVIG
jgi:biotin carboxyl carrier protein